MQNCLLIGNKGSNTYFYVEINTINYNVKSYQAKERFGYSDKRRTC